MKDRIRQLMEAQHMTQQTFANFLGMAPATLSSILNERTKPTLNTVEAIKSKFSNISTDWLMFGKGPMFLDGQSEAAASSAPLAANHGEQMLDFGAPDAMGNASMVAETSPSAVGAAWSGTEPRMRAASQPNQYGGARADIVCKDKGARKITEIRVFYDDQTWESFVPKK